MYGYTGNTKQKLEIPAYHTSVEIKKEHHLDNSITTIEVRDNDCFIGYDKPFLLGKSYFFLMEYIILMTIHFSKRYHVIKF